MYVTYFTWGFQVYFKGILKGSFCFGGRVYNCGEGVTQTKATTFNIPLTQILALINYLKSLIISVYGNFGVTNVEL